MSKNLTRKGLAFGAVVALGSTLIAGSPAFAANEVTLAPSAGTTYGAISGQNFVLQATTGATISSSAYSKLKYEVLNASGMALTTTFVQAGTSVTDNDLAGSVVTTAQVVSSTGGTVTGSTSTLTLNVAAASAGTVVVNAWIDSNDNNVIDASTEFSAGSQTVTFVKPANITWTNTLTQPVLGDTKLVASLSADNNINLGQLTGAIDFGLATLATATYTTVDSATTVDTAGVFTVGENATFVAASNTLTLSKTFTPVASTYYVSQAILGSLELGTESVKATAAATVSSFQSVTSTVGDNIAVGSGTISVRNGSTVVPVSALAYKTGTTKAAAGIPVTVTITENHATNGTDTASYVAGGKTLADTTSAADKIEFVVNTNADGKVVFDITVAGTVAGTDAIVIAVAAQTKTANATASFVAATPAQMVNASVIGASAILKKASASTFDLKFAAVDSFGKGLGSGYRVKLTESAGSTVVFADVANGVASFSVTDKTTLAESYSAELQSYSATTGIYTTSGSAVAVVPVIGTSVAPETVVLTSTPSSTASPAPALALNLSALVAADTRKGEDAPTVTTGNVSTLSGTVVDLVGSGTFTDVTLSATGAMFETNGVFALGSITVQSNATGAFGGVKLYSNTAGDTVVTATAGGKTKTVTVAFDVAAVGTGTSWTVDAPATIVPGRTLTITPVVTDKWGNKVADLVSFTYVVPGLPISAGVPTAANVAYKVLLGAGDAGTSTVTVKFSTDANGVYTDDLDVTVAKTITIAATPVVVVAPKAAVIATKNGRVYVTVNTPAGFRAAVKVGFSQKPTFRTTGSNLVSYYVGAGKRVAVVVTVRGGVVASQAVTVK